MGNTSRHSKKFRDAVSAAFRKALDDRPGLTQTAAAEQLGVTRSAFNQYLKGKITPQPHILFEAGKRWNVKVIVDGYEYDPRTVPVPRGRRPEATPTQRVFSFMEEPAEFSDPLKRVLVRVGRGRADTLEVHVELKLSS